VETGKTSQNTRKKVLEEHACHMHNRVRYRQSSVDCLCSFVSFQVFDKCRKYVGLVRVKSGLRRPSGILLDSVNQALYVLNLWGNSMVKYRLVKRN
jgi:hypothetical protein